MQEWLSCPAPFDHTSGLRPARQSSTSFEATALTRRSLRAAHDRAPAGRFRTGEPATGRTARGILNRALALADFASVPAHCADRQGLTKIKNLRVYWPDPSIDGLRDLFQRVGADADHQSARSGAIVTTDGGYLASWCSTTRHGMAMPCTTY
jgi:hypothetical protein